MASRLFGFLLINTRAAEKDVDQAHELLAELSFDLQFQPIHPPRGSLQTHPARVTMRTRMPIARQHRFCSVLVHACLLTSLKFVGLWSF